MGTCLTKARQRDGCDFTDDNYLTLPAIARREGISVTSVHRFNDYTQQTCVKRPPSPPCSSRSISYDFDTQSRDDGSISRDQHLQHAVEGFRFYIVESVRVRDLMPHLQDFIDDHIVILNQSSPREAALQLIDALSNSQVTGRWQAFMDALHAGGYPYLVRLINGHTDKDQHIRTNLLKLYQRQLIENIHLDMFLDKLFERHVLHENDVQEIKSERDRRGENAAIMMMLDFVPRREESWFEMFIDILRQTGMDDIAEQIEDVDTKPPPRCSPPHMELTCYTPPPVYTENSSIHAKELQKNAEKIRRLQREKDEKQKVICQRKEIKELKDTHKQLDEHLGQLMPDDSASETDSYSDKGSEKMTDGSQGSATGFQSKEVNNNVHQNYHETFKSENITDFRSIQNRTYDEDNWIFRDQLSDLPGTSNESNTPVYFTNIKKGTQWSNESSNELLKSLTMSVEDLITEYKDLKDNFIKLSERVDEGFRSLNGNPPAPHNLNPPVDSAFSDGSIISITSL